MNLPINWYSNPFKYFVICKKRGIWRFFISYAHPSFVFCVHVYDEYLENAYEHGLFRYGYVHGCEAHEHHQNAHADDAYQCERVNECELSAYECESACVFHCL